MSIWQLTRVCSLAFSSYFCSFSFSFFFFCFDLSFYLLLLVIPYDVRLYAFAWERGEWGQEWYCKDDKRYFISGNWQTSAEYEFPKYTHHSKLSHSLFYTLSLSLSPLSLSLFLPLFSRLLIVCWSIFYSWVLRIYSPQVGHSFEFDDMHVTLYLFALSPQFLVFSKRSHTCVCVFFFSLHIFFSFCFCFGFRLFFCAHIYRVTHSNWVFI